MLGRFPKRSIKDILYVEELPNDYPQGGLIKHKINWFQKLIFNWNRKKTWIVSCGTAICTGLTFVPSPATKAIGFIGLGLFGLIGGSRIVNVLIKSDNKVIGVPGELKLNWSALFEIILNILNKLFKKGNKDGMASK